MIAAMSSGSLFRVLKTDGAARVGRLSLPGHAPVETPSLLLYTFKGSALNLTPDLVAKLPPAAGAALDATHFIKHPPPDVIQQHGGGARGFLSPLDLPLVVTARDAIAYEYNGSTNRDSETYVRTTWGHVTVSPASYMAIIDALRPDLWTALADEVAATASRKRVRASVTRTALWLDACIAARVALGITSPLLAPVAGGADPEERARSAQEAAARDGVAGFALTGFGTGESREQQAEALAAAVSELPEAAPRLAQGIGAPDAVLAAVERGMDLFDSGYAHSATAAGTALTFPVSSAGADDAARDAADGGADGGAAASSRGNTDGEGPAIDLRDTRHRLSQAPLLAGCTCYTCSRHSRSYIHHLLQTRELLALVLLDVHNCHHTLQFFEAMRVAIAAGRFAAFRGAVLESVQAGGLPPESMELSREALGSDVTQNAAAAVQ